MRLRCGLPLRLDAYEAAALAEALHENGNKALEASRALGISKSTFYRKLERALEHYPHLFEALGRRARRGGKGMGVVAP